jgi:hypothetical protein
MLPTSSVITLKAAIRYQFKTGQRDWPETSLFYLVAVFVFKGWFSFAHLPYCRSWCANCAGRI